MATTSEHLCHDQPPDQPWVACTLPAGHLGPHQAKGVDCVLVEWIEPVEWQEEIAA